MRSIVAEHPVQLIRPADQARQLVSLPQIGARIGIDEHLDDVGFGLRVTLGAGGGGEVHPRRGVHTVRRGGDSLQGVARTDVLFGGCHLRVERHRLRSRFDDEQMPVEQRIQRLAVEDHQAAAGEHHQHGRGEQPNPEVQPPDPAQNSRVSAARRTLRRRHRP